MSNGVCQRIGIVIITPESCELRGIEGFNCLEFKYKIYKENLGVSNEGLRRASSWEMIFSHKISSQRFHSKTVSLCCLMMRLAAACLKKMFTAKCDQHS